MPRPRKDRPSVPLPPAVSGTHDMPLALAAERYLRGLVLDGPLVPGTSAPLEEIARHLGISRQPVRDAAARLAADGLLEILPQVGCRVPHPTPAVVADFFRLFAATEAVVVRLGAERRTPDEAAAFADLATRLEIEAGMAGGPEACDPRYRTINRAFFDAIHAMARSAFVAAAAESLWDRSDFYIGAAFGSLYFTAQVRQSNRRIVAAIIAADGPAAETATRLHLEAVGRRTSHALAHPNATPVSTT